MVDHHPSSCVPWTRRVSAHAVAASALLVLCVAAVAHAAPPATTPPPAAAKASPPAPVLPSTTPPAALRTDIDNSQNTVEAAEQRKMSAVESGILDLRRQLMKLQTVGSNLNSQNVDSIHTVDAAREEANKLRLELDELSRRQSLLQPGTEEQTREMMMKAKIEAIQRRRQEELARENMKLKKEQILYDLAKEHDHKMVVSQRHVDEDDSKRHTKLLHSIVTKSYQQLAALERKHKEKEVEEHNSEIHTKRKQHKIIERERLQKSEENKAKSDAVEKHYKQSLSALKAKHDSEIKEAQSKSKARAKGRATSEDNRKQKVKKHEERKAKRTKLHREDKAKLREARKWQLKNEHELDEKERTKKTQEKANKSVYMTTRQEKTLEQISADAEEEKEDLRDKLLQFASEADHKVDAARAQAESSLKVIAKKQQVHVAREQQRAEHRQKAAIQASVNERGAKVQIHEAQGKEKAYQDHQEELQKMAIRAGQRDQSSHDADSGSKSESKSESGSESKSESETDSQDTNSAADDSNSSSEPQSSQSSRSSE